MRRLPSGVILAGLTAGHNDHYRSKLLLTIIEPIGHSTNFRSVALPAPRGLTITYHFACRRVPVRMTVVIAPQTVGYSPIRRRDVLARFETVRAVRLGGAYIYQKGGWYRLSVSMPSTCSWTIRLFV
jgi:hypothetical protein